jgi:hypothetical protein
VGWFARWFGSRGSVTFQEKRANMFARLGMRDPHTIHSSQASTSGRVTKCFGCGKTLSSRGNPECRGCGWLVCKLDGACKCTRPLF